MSALFEDELVELRKEVEHLREERARLDAEIFRLHRQSEVISLDHIDAADLRYGLRVQVVGASLITSVTIPEDGDLATLQDRYFLLPEVQHPTQESISI